MTARGYGLVGRPPIGVLFISRFDEEKNALLLRVFSGEEPGECFDDVLAYDPVAKMLDNGVKIATTHSRYAAGLGRVP